MQTLCDQPYLAPPNTQATLSQAAVDYVLAIQKKNGDGYNATLGFPIGWHSKCLINADGYPDCAHLFDAHPKLTGMKTIATPPAGVTLTSCSLYMDGTTITSPTCWNGADIKDVTVVQQKSAWPEGAIRAINLTVNAVDVNNGALPFQVFYTHCQFAYGFTDNPFGFNPINQALVTDPRVTNWIPDKGEFGQSGALRGKNVTTGEPVVQKNYAPKGGGIIGPGSQVGGR